MWTNDGDYGTRYKPDPVSGKTNLIAIRSFDGGGWIGMIDSIVTANDGTISSTEDPGRVDMEMMSATHSCSGLISSWPLTRSGY